MTANNLPRHFVMQERTGVLTQKVESYGRKTCASFEKVFYTFLLMSYSWAVYIYAATLYRDIAREYNYIF